MNQGPIKYSTSFFEPILDSIIEHVAVIDRYGAILYVNRPWVEFGIANGLGAPQWLGQNYLEACARAADNGDTSADDAAASIRSVINKETVVTYLEYQCHSPEERRWFAMRTSSLRSSSEMYLISHQNITERILAEEKLRELQAVADEFN